MGSWELSSDDKIYISLICIYSVVIGVLWNVPFLNPVLKPFKLITIALHEFGHASACVLTGGKVESITVEADEGGLTTMRGGVRWITLPAGYLGSCLWGGLMIFFSKDSVGVQVMAGLLGGVCVLVLWWSDNWLVRGVIVLFMALIGAFWAIQLTTSFRGLEYFVLLFGVMSCLYSIWDIWDDTIRRRVNESDASQFAKECPCCPSRGWGLIWSVIAIAVAAGSATAAVYIW
mmetsp:Transcript_28643/g.71921  ORF Transcript_28643/g.71921 Transcript_28643/m.71921 type:complete len:232 (-) Transcript_28643:21-716(-)